MTPISIPSDRDALITELTPEQIKDPMGVMMDLCREFKIGESKRNLWDLLLDVEYEYKDGKNIVTLNSAISCQNCFIICY